MKETCRWCGIALVVEDDHGNSIQQGQDGECDECHWWKKREPPEFPVYVGWDGREHAEYGLCGYAASRRQEGHANELQPQVT